MHNGRRSTEMTEGAIKQANDAVTKQVSAQVSRITGELNRLEQLLSAGMVDRRVVAEFRDAVNRVRQTSWQVQYWMDGDLQTLSSKLIEARIRTASQLANQLAADLQGNNEDVAGLSDLRDSIQRLEQVLDESVVSTLLSFSLRRQIRLLSREFAAKCVAFAFRSPDHGDHGD